eukprot:12561223-Heterocapsa_arctica.AAC.1
MASSDSSSDLDHQGGLQPCHHCFLRELNLLLLLLEGTPYLAPLVGLVVDEGLVVKSPNSIANDRFRLPCNWQVGELEGSSSPLGCALLCPCPELLRPLVLEDALDSLGFGSGEGLDGDDDVEVAPGYGLASPEPSQPCPPTSRW